MKKSNKVITLLAVVTLLFSSCLGDDAYSTEPVFIIDPVEPQDTAMLTFPSGSTVQRMGLDYIWLGDILLSSKHLHEVISTGFIHGIKRIEDGGGPNLERLPVTNMPSDRNRPANSRASVGIYPGIQASTWAMVRYVYAPDLTPDRKKIVREAIAHWETHTNVRFYNATGQPTSDAQYGFDYPYVEFVNGNLNNSHVGLIGGRQVINLASFQSTRVAIHEIGHAIGLFHEQSAFNRDDFMNIHFSNIKPEARHNFDKVTSNYYTVGSVDFNSIMMHSSYVGDLAVVYNASIPVMTKKDGSTWGNADELSARDKMWANLFYLPYIARSDTYRELADKVYKVDNTIMTPDERIELQTQINNGNPNPPEGGRIPNHH